MRLLEKQLKAELMKNKVFVSLMFLLAIFTSFMYFFVHFSIDGNLKRLNACGHLSESQILYQNALHSNTILARSILFAFIALSAFVYSMFYYRFMKAQSRQLGVLKMLGYTDNSICRQFVKFTVWLTFLATIVGMVCGYFASDVLIQSGIKSYQVTNTVKSVGLRTVLTAYLLPNAVFSLVTVLCYIKIRGKETGVLMSGKEQQSTNSLALRIAGRISELFPEHMRLPVRLALRKPVPNLLILIAVMSFTVMMILGYSLNLSSKTVKNSQLHGHFYQYEIQYASLRNGAADTYNTAYYLTVDGVLEGRGETLDWTIAGMTERDEVYQLQNSKGNKEEFPGPGEIVVSGQLHELYGFQTGDEVILTVGNSSRKLKVSGIAFNAVSHWIFMDKEELADLMGVSHNAYNGIFSLEDRYIGGTIIDREQKLGQLNRDAVSNQVSAVINQVIGALIGCILIFLALYLNFQSSIRDILILQMMGKEKKSIRKLLIDIYRPILILTFLITLWPSILVVKGILRSLSIQIGDYMSFQTNGIILVGIFVAVNLIYSLVQITFNLGIQQITSREDILGLTEEV